MLDHVGFAVADLQRSRRFYEAALRPLGIALLYEIAPELTEAGGTALGFGSEGKAFFWIGDNERPGEGTHVAFTADSRATVRAFYAAGVGAGGRDNGAPGLRPHYHEHYYGAFLVDPDGFNVEAVCHKPELADANLHHRL
ncbi:MAG TPA: VOC family protein [Allosphingosinicella sp.]|jgi:catechol 2,3-dioxygenase-like lactoylglutathione lyase family enzyme